MIEGTKDDNGKLKLSSVPPELIEDTEIGTGGFGSTGR